MVALLAQLDLDPNPNPTSPRQPLLLLFLFVCALYFELLQLYSCIIFYIYNLLCCCFNLFQLANEFVFCSTTGTWQCLCSRSAAPSRPLASLSICNQTQISRIRRVALALHCQLLLFRLILWRVTIVHSFRSHPSPKPAPLPPLALSPFYPPFHPAHILLCCNCI